MGNKTLIGRSDKISLPEFDLVGLDVKIDTGAYGSSIHCHHIEKVIKNGEELLRFQLLDPEHPEFNDRFCYSHVFGLKVVKSSNGFPEERFTINTQLILFENTYDVEFSLTDRSDMRFPALLGRTFLKNHFIVDVSRKNLSHKKKKITV